MIATVALLVVGLAYGLLGSPSSEDGGQVPAPFAPLADAAEKTVSYPGARVAVRATIEGPAFSVPLVMRGAGSFNGETNRFGLSMEAVSGPPGGDLDAAKQDAVGEGQRMYLRGPAYGDLPGDAEWLLIDYSDLVSEKTQSQMTGDPRDALKQMRSMTGVEELASERIRGVATTHYRGTVDTRIEIDRLREQGEDERADQLERILDASGDDGSNEIDVWVDDRRRVRQMSFTVPFDVFGPGTTMAMSMQFFDFGATPEIEIPSKDEVFDGTELGLEGADALAEGS